jgi:hypothetical protein
MEGTIVVGRDCPRNVDCRLGSCRIDSSKHCSLIHIRLQTKHTPLYQFFNSLLTIGEFVIFFIIVFDLYLSFSLYVTVSSLFSTWFAFGLASFLWFHLRRSAGKKLYGGWVVNSLLVCAVFMVSGQSSKYITFVADPRFA